MRLRTILGVSGLAAGLCIAGWGIAALLNLSAGFPQMTLNENPGQGGTKYNAGMQLFTVESSPLAVRFVLGGPPRFVMPTGMPPEQVLQVRVRINNSGVLIGGDAGDDLRVVGEVDSDGDGMPDFAGVLLTGEVAEFGYENTDPAPGETLSTDVFDFRFVVTGGSMAPLFTGSDAYLRVTSEQSTFNGSFTGNFGGKAKGTLATTPATCNLNLMVQGCVVTPPPPSSGTQCVGKVISMTLRYTGMECSASHNTQAAGKVGCSGTINMASPVRIVASSATTLASALSSAKYFDGIVNLGDLFVASAANAGASQVSTNTYVYLLNPQTNALLMTVFFHTSCSQPMNVGDQYGTFLLHSLTSTNGGTVTLPPPGPGMCNTEIVPPASDNCQGKVVSMKLQYTGDNCSATQNTQARDKVSCTGDPMSTSPVRVRVSDKSGPADASAKLWFNGLVNIGQNFVASAANAGQAQIASDTWIHVFTPGGTLLQTIKFHTSCSQPLNVGDQFGSMLLSMLNTTVGGMSSLGADVVYSYKVTNNGSASLTNVHVFDDTFGQPPDGDVPGSPIPILGPGQMVTLTQTVNVIGTTTNHATAVGIRGNMVQCSDDASVTVTQLAPPHDCCAQGKPRIITMQYTGQDCTHSSHTQDPDKVSCSGNPNFMSPVRIRASNKSNPTDSGAKVWFDGLVVLNGTFDINSASAGQTHLESDTWLHIFNPNTNRVLQTIKFHTSCSQPLFEGNQFGSAKIVGCVGENEPIEGSCCDHGKLKAVTFQYTGQSCAASHHFQGGDVKCTGDPMMMTTVKIRASNKENPNDGGAKVYFSGLVTLTRQFTVDAANAGQSRLGGDVWVHVFDRSGVNLLQKFKFKADCGKPVYQGDQFGSGLVVGCVGENEPTPGQLCTGGVKPRVLTMRFTDAGCIATHHSQAAGKVICTDYGSLPPGQMGAFIRVTDSATANNPSAHVWFQGTVPILGSFNIDAANAGLTKLATNTYAYIYDMTGTTLLQTVQFHTSCSQPLIVGDQYGDMELIGFQGQ